MIGLHLRRFFKKQKTLLTDGVLALVPAREYAGSDEFGFDACVEFDITLCATKRKIGELALRMGESRQMYYLGHIGYHIDLPFRGHGYASRACQLLLPYVRELGMSSLVVTADPDNAPSRKTIESLGGVLECEIPVPPKMQKALSISAKKCRYIVLLA